MNGIVCPLTWARAKLKLKPPFWINGRKETWQRYHSRLTVYTTPPVLPNFSTLETVFWKAPVSVTENDVLAWMAMVSRKNSVEKKGSNLSGLVWREPKNIIILNNAFCYLKETHFHNKTASNNGIVIPRMSIWLLWTTYAIPAAEIIARVKKVHIIDKKVARRLGLTYSATRINVIWNAPARER